MVRSRMATLDIIILAKIFFVLFSCSAIDATIGINWGRQTPTKMVPSMVVDVLLQNNVKEAKIYTDDENVIKAFGGTDIGLTITAYNIAWVSTLDLARNWVRDKVVRFPTVNIRYVLVGTNAISLARVMKKNVFDVINAVSFVQQALDEAGLGERTKAIISNSITGVLTKPNVAKPSDAEFAQDVREAMVALVDICTKSNSPFVYDIFPIGYVYGYGIDFNYAFFDHKSNHTVKDGDLVYTNLFDFVHDSFVWALKKIGAPPNLKIIVGQIGWPTDGFPWATAAQAERYYKGLLPFVISNKGTPMRPGAPIDIYIHSLADEKSNPAFISFTRHWGIYRSNGDPKFKIDLSGQGRDIFPTAAKGIGLMPSRWCVFNKKTSDIQKVKANFDFACQNADCTSLAPGGSCSMLTFNENISYAFNVYFQSNFQAESACNFDGLGEIVVENPSRDGCVFSIEVVRGSTGSNGGCGRKLDGMPTFVLLLLLVFGLVALVF